MRRTKCHEVVHPGRPKLSGHGMALGGRLSGAIFDLTGSYRAAFVHGFLGNVLNIAIAAFLLRRPRRRAARA